jgi:ABC-type sugar transport system substrate-binding protein
MKTTLVRLLALTALATALTGLAAASESKGHDTAASVTQQQNGCASATEEGKKQKKEKKTGDRSGQEQEFDRVLMAIYG